MKQTLLTGVLGADTPAAVAAADEGGEIEYRAPFILPWVVLREDAALEQPESFVPFSTGPEGAPQTPRSPAPTGTQKPQGPQLQTY